MKQIGMVEEAPELKPENLPGTQSGHGLFVSQCSSEANCPEGREKEWAQCTFYK